MVDTPLAMSRLRRAELAGGVQEIGQHLGDGAIELLREFLIERQLRQRRRELRIFHQRHAMMPRDLGQPLGRLALADRGDARRRNLVVFERDGKRRLVRSLVAHDARFTNWPCGAATLVWSCVRQCRSPASRCARVRPLCNVARFAWRAAALAGFSATRVTLVVSPICDTRARTAPSGSISTAKRTLQTGACCSRFCGAWRSICNCITAVPCGVVSGLSKTKRWVWSSGGCEGCCDAGSEAICSITWRAIAASVCSSTLVAAWRRP